MQQFTWVRPFICLPALRVSESCWNLSQLSKGEGRVTPCTNGQFIRESHRDKQRQTTISTYTHTYVLVHLSSPIKTSLPLFLHTRVWWFHYVYCVYIEKMQQSHFADWFIDSFFWPTNCKKQIRHNLMEQNLYVRVTIVTFIVTYSEYSICSFTLHFAFIFFTKAQQGCTTLHFVPCR